MSNLSGLNCMFAFLILPRMWKTTPSTCLLKLNKFSRKGYYTFTYFVNLHILKRSLGLPQDSAQLDAKVGPEKTQNHISPSLA